jgi:NAD(P)-dependent dehydrogenase (short-subunit alcohol dehydrogenase family)
MLDRMSEQTIALITGANKGIGYAIAAGLGVLGWSVGVGARDDQRRAPRPRAGRAIAIRLATLPDDGPTGGFFDDTGIVPW